MRILDPKTIPEQFNKELVKDVFTRLGREVPKTDPAILGLVLIELAMQAYQLGLQEGRKEATAFYTNFTHDIVSKLVE